MTEERLSIGGNRPPEMAVTAGEIAKDLSGWMAENPVIENEDQARSAKVYIDRGSLCLKDLEDERKTIVGPLNEQIKTINNRYHSPRELLGRVVDELKTRIDRFLLAVETKRLAAAREAARIAKDAEQAAREAEKQERSALEDADAGSLGIDVADVTAKADEKFAAYQKAERQAALAERETKVKIGGGFSRAISLRNSEVLVITNVIDAIGAIGVNETITDAVLKSARAYRKRYGKLPVGIAVKIERKI